MTRLNVIRSIIGLLLRSCPSAILGRVWAIVVDAVKGCTFGSSAHVGKERFKASLPTVAHGYSTGTILMKSVIAWIKATLFSRTPGMVLRGKRHPMLSGEGMTISLPVASTGDCRSRLQIGILGNCFGSAFAANMPIGGFISPVVEGEDSQHAMHLSGSVSPSGFVEFFFKTSTGFGTAAKKVASRYLAVIAAVADVVPIRRSVFVGMTEPGDSKPVSFLTSNICSWFPHCMPLFGFGLLGNNSVTNAMNQ